MTTLPAFPNWTMSRLLSEAAASWSLQHDPINPETGEWPALYRAVLGYLRHQHSSYEEDLNNGADRSQNRSPNRPNFQSDMMWEDIVFGWTKASDSSAMIFVEL
jgi:hypothetical protein